MTKYSFALVTLLAAAAAAPAAHAQAVPGQPAPAFELTDVNGRRVQLSGLRGKFVVLEWNNPSCPFVRKHYDSGNMQALQKRYTQKNVVWLTINSTAPTHDEYRKPAELATWIKQQSAVPSAAMLDPDGRVGRAYGARTTPHMYVIDPQGVVAYAGAIDDKRSTNPADTKSAHTTTSQARSMRPWPASRYARRAQPLTAARSNTPADRRDALHGPSRRASAKTRTALACA